MLLQRSRLYSGLLRLSDHSSHHCCTAGSSSDGDTSSFGAPSRATDVKRGLSTALNPSGTPSVSILKAPKSKRRRQATSSASTHDAPVSSVSGSLSSHTPPAHKTESLDTPSHTAASRNDQLKQLMYHPTLFDPIRKPKNPIVLCHGLYGFDVRGPAGSAYQLHYWGAILEILRGKVGAEVIVSRVPGTGSIEGRAKALDAVLQKEVPGREINLLAHSMGGLDARYLISRIKPEAYKVRSLTTVSTPHRGSPFMEWCSSTMGLARDVDAKKEDTARSTLAHWTGVGLAEYFAALFDSPAYRDLLPSYLEKRFNPSVPDVPDVRYYSVAARAGDLGIWHPLYWPKAVIDAEDAKAVREGRGPSAELRGNDGLVTVSSAQWGNFLGVVDNCDHWRIRGSSGFRSAAPMKPELAEVTAQKTAMNGDGEKRTSLSEPVYQAAQSISDRASALNKEAEQKLKALENAKKTESRPWSWEDVNTIVDPLRSLVSPLNRLLSLVPSRSSSSSAVSLTASISPTTRYMRPSASVPKMPAPAGTSPTTHYITLSLPEVTPAATTKPIQRSSSSGFLSYFYTTKTPTPAAMSPTTRYIRLSYGVSPPATLADSNKSKVAVSSSGGGLLSYFKRTASATLPSPTTRYVQLSLGFSPRREPAPTTFRTVPNLSGLLAPPAFFTSATDKESSKQVKAADTGAKDAFDLERLYVAIARKLADEGL